MWEFESGSNTVPIEKGTEIMNPLTAGLAILDAKQHRPHREGD
jgi:hypothetical protein